jgi:hypothetical protein
MGLIFSNQKRKKVKRIVFERALMRRPWRYELPGRENVANVSGYSQSAMREGMNCQEQRM